MKDLSGTNRRAFAAFLLAVLFLLKTAFPAGAQGAPLSSEGRAALLKAALERKFSPQSMEVRLEGGPDAKGFVKRAVVRAKGAVIDRLRVESLVMEASDLQFNPPEEWDRKLEVKSAGETRSRGVILEKDINAAMAESVKGDKKWKSIRMDLSPRQIKAVGVYEVHNNGGWYDFGFVLGLSMIFGGSGGGIIRGRRRR